MDAPNCLRCGKVMEPGFIIDKGIPGGSMSAPEWAEGAPERSFWTGLKLGGRERHVVQTYRCPGCGFLESYAVAS